MRPYGQCPPSSSVHGILLAGILEWVAMPASRVSSLLSNRTHASYVSCVVRRFFITGTNWEALPRIAVLASACSSFEKGLCICVHTQLLSHVILFVTSWTVAHQVPQSMGFPRQEYWSGLLYPSPGDLLDPGIEPASLASPASAEGSGKPKKRWGIFVI